MEEALNIDDLRVYIIYCYEKMLWDISYNEYGDEPTECLSPIQTQEEKFDKLRAKLRLSVPITEEVIERFSKDQEITEYAHEKIVGIDHYKIAGFLTFWIVKLKPIMIFSDLPTEDEMLINELLAITIACGLIYDKHDESPPFNDKIIRDLKYTLRYRINTRHDIALMYECLCRYFDYEHEGS